MKTELTPEESAKLIELGVDPKLANGVKRIKEPFGEHEWESELPIFKLTDILAILPKELCEWRYGIRSDCHLSMYNYNDKCGAMYRLDSGDDFLVVFESPELIDALNQLLIWCINNGHYNPKNKEK